MPNFTNQDFESHAEQITRSFQAGESNGGSTLNDLVTKVAKDLNLTPEQVSRLCKRVNVKNFEVKFAAMDGDKNVKFELAQPEQVVASLFKDAEIKTAEVADLYPDLPKPTPLPLLDSVKLASAEAHAARTASFLPTTPPVDILYERARKMTEVLEGRAKQADDAWNSAVNGVIARTKGIRWDHDAFEKSALCLVGDVAVPELEQVRSTLGMPALGLDQTKVAALVDRIDVKPTQEALLIKRAADARKSCYENVTAAQASAEARDGYHAKLKELLRG